MRKYAKAEALGLLGTGSESAASSDPIGDALRADAKAYWPFDANGNDATGRGNNLTNNNTVTFVAGKVNNAANFVSASSQYFNRASNSDLAPSGTLSICTWVFHTGTDQLFMASKDVPALEYQLYFVDPEGLAFAYGNSGYVVSSTGLSADAWHMVDAYYDSVLDEVGIAVDNGSYDTAGSVGGVATSSGDFRIGGQSTLVGAGNFSNGKQDETLLLHRKLTQTERDYLYNSGTGRTLYP